MLTRALARAALWGTLATGLPSLSLAAGPLRPAVRDSLRATLPEHRPPDYHQVLQQAGRLERLRHPWLRRPFPVGSRDRWQPARAEREIATTGLPAGPTGVALGDFVFIRLPLDRPPRALRL